MIQFTKSLSGLAVETMDLFLLHYPTCWPELCGEGFTPKGTWHDSWRALEALVDKGLVRAIGALPPANPRVVSVHTHPPAFLLPCQAQITLQGRSHSRVLSEKV